MFMPGFGIGEFLTMLIVVALSLALPVAILFGLYKIHIRLKNIEELLKKN